MGDGIKPSSKIADAAKKEELQKLWLAWTDEADAEGLTDFFGLQRRAAREVFLAGEVFLRIRTRRPEDGLPKQRTLVDQMLTKGLITMPEAYSNCIDNAYLSLQETRCFQCSIKVLSSICCIVDQSSDHFGDDLCVDTLINDSRHFLP